MGNDRTTHEGRMVYRPPVQHRCNLPVGALNGLERGPLAARGSVWRCACRRLWRVGEACDWCDRYDVGPHQGQCTVGAKWRPATAWQWVRYWRQP
jgi:hypothetical protein